MSKIFTREELQEFDGTGGKPAYLAYLGKVYDVTGSDLFEDGEHYEHYAGQDLTAAIEEAPHGDEVLEPFPVVGELEE